MTTSWPGVLFAAAALGLIQCSILARRARRAEDWQTAVRLDLGMLGLGLLMLAASAVWMLS